MVFAIELSYPPPGANATTTVRGPFGSVLVRNGAQDDMTAVTNGGVDVFRLEDGRAIVQPFDELYIRWGASATVNDPPLELVAFEDSSALLYERPRVADPPGSHWVYLHTNGSTSSTTITAGSTTTIYEIPSIAGGIAAPNRRTPHVIYPSLWIMVGMVSGTGSGDLIVRATDARGSQAYVTKTGRSSTSGAASPFTAHVATGLVPYPPWGGVVAVKNNSAGNQGWRALVLASTLPPSSI